MFILICLGIFNTFILDCESKKHEFEKHVNGRQAEKQILDDILGSKGRRKNKSINSLTTSFPEFISQNNTIMYISRNHSWARLRLCFWTNIAAYDPRIRPSGTNSLGKLKEIFCHRQISTWSWKQCEFTKSNDTNFSKIIGHHAWNSIFNSQVCICTKYCMYVFFYR